MTISGLIQQVRISDVFIALGGQVRGRRGKAFWRGGKHWSVGLYDSTGRYRDYARGESGGILDLIVCVLRCTRGEAAQWLAHYAGTTLDAERSSADIGPTPQEKREVEEWQDEMEDSLKVQRDYSFFNYHVARRQVTRWGLDTWRGAEAAEICEEEERRYQLLDAQRDALRGTSWSTLLRLYQLDKKGKVK